MSIVLLAQALMFFGTCYFTLWQSILCLFILHSLPIPEGLAPLAPAHIDSHLVSLINRYTLRGVPILVHCRGGVGRAGVIACCWAIRLGLCGWVGNPRASTAEDAFPNDEVLTYVEGVISFVRRQRSMKAIETYEQVKFLVDYVEYLRKQSTLCNI